MTKESLGYILKYLYVWWSVIPYRLEGRSVSRSFHTARKAHISPRHIPTIMHPSDVSRVGRGSCSRRDVEVAEEEVSMSEDLQSFPRSTRSRTYTQLDAEDLSLRNVLPIQPAAITGH